MDEESCEVAGSTVVSGCVGRGSSPCSEDLVFHMAIGARGDRYPNLRVKKIPKAVLARCEWGHDDYSLRVENLPKAPPKPGQLSMFGEEAK